LGGLQVLLEPFHLPLCRHGRDHWCNGRWLCRCPCPRVRHRTNLPSLATSPVERLFSSIV
jgi:hypothetical protein